MPVANDDKIRQYKAILAIKQATFLAARPIFDKYFPADSLQSRLQNIKCDILNNNDFEKVQKDILYPRNGNSSSADYDITLMINLLRHYSMIKIPIHGFDKLPLPSETGDGADLAIIKYWRNKIFHTKGQMTTSEYEEFIKVLNAVTQRHSGRNVDQEYDDAKNGSQVFDVYNDSGKITVFIIVVSGAGYVWYIISDERNDILRRNPEKFEVMLDVKSLNKKDGTRLTDWTHELYKNGHETDPFPLITSGLLWRVPDIEMSSNPLSFQLSNCENVNATKYLLLSLCRFPQVSNKDINERTDQDAVPFPLLPDTSEDTKSLYGQCRLLEYNGQITCRSTTTDNDGASFAVLPSERNTYAATNPLSSYLIAEAVNLSSPICPPATYPFLECSGRTTTTSSLSFGFYNNCSIDFPSSNATVCSDLTQIGKETNTCVCS